jgi:hypothetical protein
MTPMRSEEVILTEFKNKTQQIHDLHDLPIHLNTEL